MIQNDPLLKWMVVRFEETCAELGIGLYILPLKQLPYNGTVERGNRTFGEEFYDRRDMVAALAYAINAEL